MLTPTATAKGSWNAKLPTLEAIDWAARAFVPKAAAKIVNTSNAKYSASTITTPGNAKANMGRQFTKAFFKLSPAQHFLPSTKTTYAHKSNAMDQYPRTSAIGAPMNPSPYFGCHTKSQLARKFNGTATAKTYVPALKMCCACKKRLPVSKNSKPGAPKRRIRKYVWHISAKSGSGTKCFKMAPDHHHNGASGKIVSAKIISEHRWK